MPVREVRTTDTGRDISGLLAEAEGLYGCDAVYLLGGARAEGAMREHAAREHTWPDVSYGLFQPAVKWLDLPPGLLKGPDPLSKPGQADPKNPAFWVALDTASNRQMARDWHWDAARAVRYAAPRYAALLKIYHDPLEAWCRWNKPGIPGDRNPNRLNYQEGLAWAEQYRRTPQEDRAVLDLKLPDQKDFPPQSFTSFTELAGYLAGEEFRKSVLEYALAQSLQGNVDAACAALAYLNPKYDGLAPSPKG